MNSEEIKIVFMQMWLVIKNRDENYDETEYSIKTDLGRYK